jgi:hypothetical protein
VLLHTAEENGDVAFIVGPSNTRIRAHSIIVQSASPVKLFHENMEEGKTKEVKLPHYGVKAFRSDWSAMPCTIMHSHYPQGHPHLHVHAHRDGCRPGRACRGAHGRRERVPAPVSPCEV